MAHHPGRGDACHRVAGGRSGFRQPGFGDHLPYAPEQTTALLTEVGYDANQPLRYTLMVPSAEPLLATIAAIMKSQYARLGVEVTVEMLDRPILLRRFTRDHNWDQLLQLGGAAFDVEEASQALDTRAGNTTLNHQDKQVNALIDRLRQAATEEAYLQAGHDLQRYVTEHMLFQGVTTLPVIQAARTPVRRYPYGNPIRFETTWIEAP